LKTTVLGYGSTNKNPIKINVLLCLLIFYEHDNQRNIMTITTLPKYA